MAPTIITLDLLLCLVLAYFGRRSNMGFWGLFFASVLLTPVVGVILFLVTRKTEPRYIPGK
ncbi:hypothetical protein ACMAY5_07860 [Arenicellales bacterium nBUS_48]|jgi:hypothetical protein